MKITPLVGKIHSSLEILMLIDLPLLACAIALGMAAGKEAFREHFQICAFIID